MESRKETRSVPRRHLTSIEDLDRDALLRLISNARGFIEVSERDIKKVPALRGKTIINLFLEPSTRTRASFEIAGKRLSADTINLSGTGSSVSKGESLLDMARTLQSMRPDVVVVRDGRSGATQFLAERLMGTSFINAGDGKRGHPTQAILDLVALCEARASAVEKEPTPESLLTGLTVAIVGDIFHSRVARSLIQAHLLLGNEVRLIGPPTFISPWMLPEESRERVKIFSDLKTGLEGCHSVTALRIQLERQGSYFFSDTREYAREFGLGLELIESCCPDAFIMHPGPMNRGIEIETPLADSSRSLVELQVRMGVATRMALLFEFANQGVGSSSDLEAAA